MLQAVHLSKKYGTQQALNELNFSVGGEIYCLLGTTGAGKTTTINLYLDFIKPSSDDVLINNINSINPIGLRFIL